MPDESSTAPRSNQPGADAAKPGGPAAAKPGDRIGGQYRLVSLLGSGGMGDVWLAHNETLDIEVAIKLVRPRAGDKDAEGRLLAEARAAARLGHPAIVRVFDFGQTENGTPYIVMERLLGEDLATALGRLGRLSPVKAVRTLLPVVHALSVAHHKGIVHRDLKPENVFLAKVEGDRLQPKIVDFGIARVDRNVRRSGATAAFGSPSYMSPEQVRGEDGDSRMDQWSLSVVLYEAIAGKRPFSASTTDALLVAITDDPPEPLPALPGTDEALQKILLRGLAKAPADRYPTMRELGEALVDWLMARDVHEDISGASVEALFERGSEDALGTIRPGAAPVEQESLGTDTVIRSSRAAPRAVAAPRPGPPPVLILIAVVAGVLGVALGVVLGWKPKAPAPLPSASVAPATPPGPSAPIPVEPLEAIPVDLGAGAAASAEKPKSRAPEVRTFRKPKRSLKDPFQ